MDDDVICVFILHNWFLHNTVELMCSVRWLKTDVTLFFFLFGVGFPDNCYLFETVDVAIRSSAPFPTIRNLVDERKRLLIQETKLCTLKENGFDAESSRRTKSRGSTLLTRSSANKPLLKRLIIGDEKRILYKNSREKPTTWSKGKEQAQWCAKLAKFSVWLPRNFVSIFRVLLLGNRTGKFKQTLYSTGQTKRNNSNKTPWFRKLRERDFSSHVARNASQTKFAWIGRVVEECRFKRRDIFCPATRIADNFPSIEGTPEKVADASKFNGKWLAPQSSVQRRLNVQRADRIHHSLRPYKVSNVRWFAINFRPYYRLFPRPIGPVY